MFLKFFIHNNLFRADIINKQLFIMAFYSYSLFGAIFTKKLGKIIIYKTNIYLLDKKKITEKGTLLEPCQFEGKQRFFLREICYCKSSKNQWFTTFT